MASDSAGIGEIKSREDYEEAQTKHDFTFISFYTDDDEAKKVDDLMEDVKIYIDKKIENGDWQDRSIGWFRGNTSKNHDLRHDGEPFSSQLIFASHIHVERFIDFNILEGESREDSVEHLAIIVRSFTGDWFSEMTCDELQAEDRPFYDELLYMGEAKDLEVGSFADTMRSVAMKEKYTQGSNQAGFGYVSDPACRESYGLDADKNSIMILNGFNSLPVHVNLEKD